MTVLRPASSLKKTKEPESAQAGPNETRLAGAPTTPGDLLREPVSRDWPLVYLERLARCPEAGDRQETADLAALKSPEGVATFLGGRDWEKRSLGTAAPWNTGRVSRLISWGHWGETGTVWCGVHRSSPEGPALKSPGPLASGHSSRRIFSFWKWWSADLSLARERHSDSDSFGEYENLTFHSQIKLPRQHTSHSENKTIQIFLERNCCRLAHSQSRGKRQVERQALSLVGRTAGRASDLRKQVLDLMGKEEDRARPS